MDIAGYIVMLGLGALIGFAAGMYLAIWIIGDGCGTGENEGAKASNTKN